MQHYFPMINTNFFIQGYAKVFSHDTRGGVFSSQADVANKNSDNPSAYLFSILDQLERFRETDGKFKFKLCYPELAWGVGGRTCNVWRQSSNPLTETTIKGFESISLAFTKDSYLRDWRGLGKSPSNYPYAAIDDAPTESAWWTAIGATRLHYGKIPGPRSDRASNIDAVTKVQLYVQNQGKCLS